MRGDLVVYLQVSNRKQVRADIKVIKTKFTKVTPAAAAQTKGSVSEIHDGNTDSQGGEKEGRKGRRKDGGKTVRTTIRKD